MDYFVRKIYFSIFASILIVITAATTSYAWYSSNQNAIVDRFSLNVYNSDDKEGVSLKMSITGEENDFHQYLNEYDLKKAILYTKIGKKETDDLGNGKTDLSKRNIDNMFNRIVKLTNATPDTDSSEIDLTKGFTRFDLENKTSETTSDIISFDLYFAVENEGTYVSEGTNVYINSYIDNNDKVINKFAESSDITCNLLTPLPHGGIDSITGEVLVKEDMKSFKVNALNALRFGYTTYSALPKGQISSEENVKKQDLYSLSSQDACLIDNVYNFGGFNGDNNGYNAMLMYYNSIYNDESINNVVPDYIKNRNDKYLYSSDTDKKIISKEYGLNTETMIKVRFYFWLEGWDADCFNALSDAKIDFSVYLSTVEPNLS